MLPLRIHCVRLIDGRDDSGPPLQRTQANTASLLQYADYCSGGSPPVKRHISTTVSARSVNGTDMGQTQTNRQGVMHKWPRKGGPLIMH